MLNIAQRVILLLFLFVRSVLQNLTQCGQ